MEKKLVIEESGGSIDRKEFMRQVGMSVGGIILMNCLQACGDSEVPDPNPNPNTGKVDFTINLSQATYNNLNTPGGSYVDTTRKIIIARTLANDPTFIAVQSNCTHESVTIQYQANNNVFNCPNPPGHGSRFDATGKVVNGPATAALKKYSNTYDVNAKTLRIFEV